MSLSQEIVDSIITRNNVNANETIYNALYGKASEQIAMRKVEIAQTMFNGNDEEYDEDGEETIEYENEVPEEEYEQ